MIKSRAPEEHREYEARGHALEFLYAKDREILICGRIGTGKTRVGCEKIHLLAEKYPGSRHLMLRQVRRSLTETALVTLEDHVMPVGHPAKRGAHRRNRSSYTYPNGSEIVLGGLDDPDKIMSGEYDTVYVVEALETIEESIEMLITRLRNGKMPYQQLLMDCNPGPPSHWLKARCDRGQTRMIHTSIKDNPRFWSIEKDCYTPEGEAYDAGNQGLTGARRKRLLEGMWVAPEGARFDQAAREVQGFKFYDRFPQGIPQDFKCWISCDYGTSNPYCALWHCEDYDGNIYTYRCDYQRGYKAHQQAQRILELSPDNERYYTVYLDGSMWNTAFENVNTTEPPPAEQYERVFDGDDKANGRSRFGPLTAGSKNRDERGYITLDALLARDNTEPNWYIERGCEGLWNELENAQYYRSATTGIWGEELDPKCSNHALDSAVYGLHTHLQHTEKPQDDSIDYRKVRAARLLKERQEHERAFAARTNPTRKIRI